MDRRSPRRSLQAHAARPPWNEAPRRLDPEGLVVAASIWLAAGAQEARPPTHSAATDDGRAAQLDAAVATSCPAGTPPPATQASVREEAAAPEPAAAGRGDSAVVHGRVHLADGSPVPYAVVRASGNLARTDRRGEFTIVMCADGDDLAVIANPAVTPQIRGLAVVEDVLARSDVRAGQSLDVAMPDAALAIDGGLVLADGTPARDWQLLLTGGTTDCGSRCLPALSAGDFAAGARSTREVATSPGEPERNDGTNPNHCRVGDDGTFRVGGLRADHDYVLRAWNASTLQVAFSPPIRAGTSGYRFVVPPGEWRDVYGRTIDRNGAPIAGVQVRLTLREHVSAGGEIYVTGQQVMTDADGRFRLSRVPLQDLLLRFDASGVMPSQIDFGPRSPSDLLIPLAAVCRFRFELVEGSLQPTSVRVLDASQRPLRLTRWIAEGQSESGQRLRWPSDGSAGEWSPSMPSGSLVGARRSAARCTSVCSRRRPPGRTGKRTSPSRSPTRRA